MTLLACLTVTALGLLPAQAKAQSESLVQTDEPIVWHESSALTDTFIINKNFWRAAGEVIGLNLMIWTYDRYIRESGSNPGFRIGFNSWEENLKNGFEWDDNQFSTNQLDHPYHGSLFFNAARSNGYSFWESVPAAFVGSYTWEYFFEVHHPSINDWIATSVGGVTFGEVLNRLSATVRDNTARGSSRFWREFGGLAINPMGGFNRIIDGDWSRVYENPTNRYPAKYRSTMNFGARKTADDHLFSSVDTTGAYVEFDFDFGDPFFGDMEKPFDHFNFALQLNFKDEKLLGRAQINGLLAGTVISESENVTHIVGTFLHYDYVNNSNFKFGAQSVGVGMLSRYTTAHGLEVRTELHANVILVGASLSDYHTFTGREYDYGPGASVEFAAQFGANGWHFLRLSHEQMYIHTVNGTEADHHIGVTTAALTVPITKTWGTGIEYVLYTSEKIYKNFENTSDRAPQLRLYATLLIR